MSSVSSNGTLPIRLARLDAIAIEKGMPGFLKIDVGDHAGSVSKGAKTVLEHRPCMMIEIHDASEKDAVMAELLDRYRLMHLDSDSEYPRRMAAIPK